MKRLIWAGLLALSCIPTFALPNEDSFADATGSGGTSYTVGGNLIGQTDAQGHAWVLAGGAASPSPTIASGNLSVPGLLDGGGNSVRLTPYATGMAARYNIGSTTSSGTIYYSLAFQITDLGALQASGAFFAGFNNSSGAQGTVPSVIGTRLLVRPATGGFNIGLSKNSSTAADFAWDSAVYTTSDTIFVVGSYTFNPTTGDDVSKLWINPSSSSFSDVEPGSGFLTATTGTDLNVASFLLFQRGTAQNPAEIIVDGLRIGLSYASVTPVPEPSTLAFLGAGFLALIARCFKRWFAAH